MVRNADLHTREDVDGKKRAERTDAILNMESSDVSGRRKEDANMENNVGLNTKMKKKPQTNKNK